MDAQLITWRWVMSRHFVAVLSLVSVFVGCTPPRGMERVTGEGAALSAPNCQSGAALWVSPSAAVGCPTVALGTGTWSPHRLFGSPSPATLARVCAYDWYPAPAYPGAAPDLGKLSVALANYGQPAPELDCPIVSPLSDRDPRDTELWKSMRDTFLAQADRVPGAVQFDAPVRVAVLDTAAHGFRERDVSDYAGHGRLVGRIIEDLTCFGEKPTCATEIENVLALPYQTAARKDEENGGVMGTLGDLALAIHDAGYNFAKLRAARQTTARRMVLNMSVGWVPRTPDDRGLDPTKFSPGTFAVYAALARATCLGFASVAAAGNAHTGSERGAVLPGGWERLPTPLVSECAALVGYAWDAPLVSLALPSSAGGKERLVYSASAVDERDRPLATTRREGLPRFVAYGLSAVTGDVGGARGDHTSVLTGTSFAAPVLSAAFAGAWALKPELSPDKIAKHIYTGAVELGTLASSDGRASLCFGPSCQAVRRVAVCRAMAVVACATGYCGRVPSCATVPVGAGEPLWLPELFARDDDTRLGLSPAYGSPFPAVSAYLDPWVHGQPPGRDGCVRCSALASTGDVRVALASHAREETAALQLETGAATYDVELPDGEVPASLHVTLPPAAGGAGSAPGRVVLVRLLEDGSRVAEDITVLR